VGSYNALKQVTSMEKLWYGIFVLFKVGRLSF